MKIDLLKIDNLRIVEEISLSPSPGISLIVGDNGAGKTTILEGVYLAGRGRSFRHSDSRPLVRNGANEAVVFCSLINEKTGQTTTLGLARGSKTLRCRLNGEDINRRSQLAEVLPVQWIGSQPQVFLDAGPDVRRRFLDMAVFHVEPGYLSTIGEYQRVLKQRNAALRTGGLHDPALWDPRLAALSGQIDDARKRAVTLIFDKVDATLEAWQLGFSVSHRYQSGWSDTIGLEAELKARQQHDAIRGVTSRGPHRAELLIQAPEGPASKVLSRGQQKMLVIAIHLATMDVIHASDRGRFPVLLIDDLAAELDYSNRERVIAEIVDRECQVLVTRLTDDRLPEESGCSTWNIEQGRLV